MAKKGGQIQLQVEVSNDDDWAKLLERDGLIIVDIYSEWCGPCSAMSGNLKKIKLEIGGDYLHLAMAKSDHIKDLVRFRDRSEPTWMFIAGGKMINLMFGANAPKLTQTVYDELKKEEAVRDGQRQRDEAEITDLSPEEQTRYDEIQRQKVLQEEIEIAAKLKAKDERLSVIIECVLNSPYAHFGLFVVFPYAMDRLNLLSEVWDTFKQGNSEKISFKNINVDDMLFYTQYRFNPAVLELAEQSNCSVYLVKNDDPELDIDEAMLKLVYGSMMESPGNPDSLADKMKTTMEPSKGKTKETDAEAKPTDEEDEESTTEETALDGIWVPEDKKTRILAMFMFFPNVVGGHVPPEPEPTPPHVAIAFDAWKRNDVMALIQEYPDVVMHFGFFSDERPDTAKLLAKNIIAFEKKAAETTYGEKMVLQLSKKRSDAVLAFAQLGPTYMSINTVDGAKECKLFFPENYEDHTDSENGSRRVKKKGSRRKMRKAAAAAEKAEGEEENLEFVEGMAVGEDLGEIAEEDNEDGLAGEEEDEILEGSDGEAEDVEDLDKATSPMAEEPTED